MEPAGASKKSPFSRLLRAVSAEYEKIGTWNEGLQRNLPKRWEKHGDLVLLPDNCFTLPEWRMMGGSLWEVVAKCLQAERVGRKRRIEKDDYRSPHVELVYGQHGWVEHVDNGVRYQYDVTKCMFSIGNVSEKLRIANMDCRNETVVDLFAGIGYFTLPYLVHANAALVHACEWNPDAVEALSRNLVTNGVDDRCVVHEGDCRKVCPVGVADRVNLGLLPSARAYWLTACKALKAEGGVLHVHENVTSSKLKRSMSEQEPAPSNSDVMVGDSVTLQYCGGIEEGGGGATASRRASVEPGLLSNAKTLDRRDSLLMEDIDSYDPPVHESFSAEWSRRVDGSWKQFSVAAARRIRRFLNNLHDTEWDATIVRVGKIKSYAPRIDHIVLDLDCRPSTTSLGSTC